MSDFHELLEQQEDMDYGPERVAVAEEAVRLADLSGDEEAGYEARMALIQTAVMSGQAEKMFPAFAWCQQYAERHPDEVDDYSLAWYHKWVLGSALQFPQIPLARLHELHASYARYARKLGAGASSIPYMQMKLAMHTGHRAEAQRAFTIWQMAGHDALSDCSACEAQNHAEYHLFMGDDAACIGQGQVILDRKMSCAEVPHQTYSLLLGPLMRAGQRERALKDAARGRKMVEGNPDLLGTQAEHLEFLALTDRAGALDWYARHLPWAEQTRELKAQMDYHAASAFLFGQLEDETVTLALPPGTQGWQESGTYRVSERLNSHTDRARKLAGQFDARNGTPYYTQKLARTLGAGAAGGSQGA